MRVGLHGSACSDNLIISAENGVARLKLRAAYHRAGFSATCHEDWLDYFGVSQTARRTRYFTTIFVNCSAREFEALLCNALDLENKEVLK